MKHKEYFQAKANLLAAIATCANGGGSAAVLAFLLWLALQPIFFVCWCIIGSEGDHG